LSALNVDVPEKLEPLLHPARYKGAYGGRGGAKSHFFAEQIIVRCFRKQTRVACIREVQTTIKDSVRQLLVNKIEKLGLGHRFEILETEIRGSNGSLIVFKGMQSYNAENIKSLEDFDIAWVEEAQTLSDHSLKLLRPTIRKPNSELWFSWNPRHDTDAVDKFFRGGATRSSMVSVEVNWQDNPWFGEPLLTEMQEDYQNDPEVAENVWGGGYQIITEGSYYGKLIAHAEKEGRVGHYPHDPLLPVITSWDIGVDDYTAIWFWQEDGYRAVAIDYYETTGDGAEQIVKAALPEMNPDEREKIAALIEADRPKPFTYKHHLLPHDVMNREWGAGAKSRYQTLISFGVKPIKVGAAQPPMERVNAFRALLPMTYFNDTQRVRVGLKRLRRYSARKNESMQTYGAPLHDDNSHGADAAGEFAVNTLIKPRVIDFKPKPKELVLTADQYGGIQSNFTIKQAVEARMKRMLAR
jgi:phage terminase large subunit